MFSLATTATSTGNSFFIISDIILLGLFMIATTIEELTLFGLHITEAPDDFQKEKVNDQKFLCFYIQFPHMRSCWI